MKAASLLVWMCANALAAPDPAALARSGLPPGFAPVAAFDEPIFIPVPKAVLLAPRVTAEDTKTVALAPLLDRHLSTTDSFGGAAGKTLVAGTLDLNGDGYLAVTPPGGTTRFIKIERGMSGGWSDGIHNYRVSLSVSIFRPRLANYIQIKNATTGRMMWEKRISELFRLTNRAGEPVVLAGRSYRLFYSQKPTHGFCFIYEDTSNGGHEYKFYMVPLSQVSGAAPTSYKLYGGDIIRLRVSPDGAALEISR